MDGELQARSKLKFKFSHIRTVLNFFENSRRYSQVKVHHWYQLHRRQICHAQVPPTPVANNENNIRLLRP
jgi:hypothetical protein